MKRNVITVIAFISAIVAVMVACNRADDQALKSEKLVLPATPYDYSSAQGVPSVTTDHQATLGRVLFYDRNLSANNAVACASCHQQSSAFADPAPGSTGFTLDHTGRNSMAIINLGDDKGFFWDLREVKLEEMVLKPALSHVEMGFADLQAIVNKIGSIDYYKPLFQKAFQDENATSERIGIALATFVRSLRSTDSKFDKSFMRGPFIDSNFFDPRIMPGEGGSIYGQTFGNFSALENLGKVKFNEFKCSKCHGAKDDFTSHDIYANIGLEFNYKDKGVNVGEFVKRSGIASSVKSTAEGYFKVPTLRNVQFTAPYMHDGRFATLDEVLDHYSTGIKNHPDLSTELKDEYGNAHKFNFTAQDKEALKAFLCTLSDKQFLTDKKFSNPFVVQ